MLCNRPPTAPDKDWRVNVRIDFLREFEIVDPASEDANPNGPVVGQEHIKDFGDPFIPERVYNGWKGKKDFEMIKVVQDHETMKLMVARESRGCRGISGHPFECCS
jgi:hypothetical protein